MNAVGLVRPGRLIRPDLLGGKGENGGHEPDQDVQDVVHGGLSAPPGRGVGRGGVEPVLEDVEVEGREVQGAVVVERVVDGVELVPVVGPASLFHQADERVAHVPVDLGHGLGGDGVTGRVEVEEVTQDEPAGVSNPAIGVAELL